MQSLHHTWRRDALTAGYKYGSGASFGLRAIQGERHFGGRTAALGMDLLADGGFLCENLNPFGISVAYGIVLLTNDM